MTSNSKDAVTRVFDLRRLHQDIDTQRQELALSWAALSKEVGVSTSTIRRYKDAEDAEADGVLLLIRWVGKSPEQYVEGASGGELLRDGGWVRVDTARIAKALDDPAVARRNRLTIQGLIAAAQKAGASVASNPLGRARLVDTRSGSSHNRS